MQHHILTTGISLLTNFAAAQTPRLSIEEALRRHKELERYFLTDPKAASAEINSLHARTGFLDQKDAVALGVTLVHTNTASGKLVASLLEKFLKRSRVRPLHKIPVKGFDKPARDFTPQFAQQEALEALTQMRERVVEHIAKLRRQSPDLAIELNCTGGYKAEIAVLYELGRALRLPVYYLHEAFKACVTLP
jgi:putative CRISPR-associated protein (TIGR02619 family)